MTRKPRRAMLRRRSTTSTTDASASSTLANKRDSTFSPKAMCKNASPQTPRTQLSAQLSDTYNTAESAAEKNMRQKTPQQDSAQDSTTTQGTNQTDPHVCARCADVHTTCCFVNPGDEEYCFPLSESEWKRIVDYCENTGGFAEQRNTQPFIDTLNRLFPNDKEKLAEIFPSHGTHRTLASREDGPCYFLSDKGCVLPRDVRPWYCRLYPFWVRSGMLTMFTAMGCLVCRESKNIPDALNQVGTNIKEVRRIFGQLRIAWGLDPDDEEL